MKKINKRGFTLTEVIAVAVIVAIISLIGIPILTGYVADSQLDSARGRLELIGTAVMHSHTRGIDISANDWNDIGITDPSDDIWAFTFTGLAANASETAVNDYSITVTGKKGQFNGQTGTYCPNKAAGSGRWTGILSHYN